MFRLVGLHWSAIPILFLAGCGDEGPQALSAYCLEGECPTLEETAADPRWASEEPPRACGDTQFLVGERTVETGWIRYFDADGNLVAAEYFSWNPGCASRLYGAVPSCPEEQQFYRRCF